ncbi:Uncharacterized protein ChrSV_1076 [Chromobacterium vaccinii]|nr:Uncharacterized protein ChrSW_1076 [Chromobacterium vaccinii]QND88534.1 Uncharacterized protein ChrSV_1076 [Chromobacterium vaccinii]
MVCNQLVSGLPGKASMQVPACQRDDFNFYVLKQLVVFSVNL